MLRLAGENIVRLWAANTDLDWFDYLAAQPEIDEVNFWQPSGNANFGSIQPGELFLFKLKSPRNVIGEFGVLSQSTNLPSHWRVKRSAQRMELGRSQKCERRSADLNETRSRQLIWLKIGAIGG